MQHPTTDREQCAYADSIERLAIEMRENTILTVVPGRAGATPSISRRLREEGKSPNQPGSAPAVANLGPGASKTG